LAVRFANATQGDLSFVTGTTFDCGRLASKTSAVVLNVIGPNGKVHHHMPYEGDGPPYIGFCAGRIGPFAVTLHARESASLPLEISSYFDLADSKQYDMAPLPAGDYSVEAEFTAERLAYPNLRTNWAGTIKSNTIQIHFNSEFAAGLSTYGH